jgi:metal-responsive CopG/Arc/MetJ family transcriptional regulator
MTVLSIMLPDSLAKASQDVAKQLGVSRTQFIRTAIIHELENTKKKMQQDEIIKTFSMMKKNKKDLKQIDGDQWWMKE